MSGGCAGATLRPAEALIEWVDGAALEPPLHGRHHTLETRPA